MRVRFCTAWIGDSIGAIPFDRPLHALAINGKSSAPSVWRPRVYTVGRDVGLNRISCAKKHRIFPVKILAARSREQQAAQSKGNESLGAFHLILHPQRF
jgi:hypothetical protein